MKDYNNGFFISKVPNIYPKQIYTISFFEHWEEFSLDMEEEIQMP